MSISNQSQFNTPPLINFFIISYSKSFTLYNHNPNFDNCIEKKGDMI